VDGIVFSEMPHGVIEGLKGSLLYGKPFVNVGAHIIDNCDIVHIDLSESARDAVLHLHDVGCRRIGYLVPDWLTWFRDHKDERLWGYEAGVRQVGQEPEFVFTPGTSRPLVDSAFKAHIEKHGAPDGLFCYNDEMAIGALRALQDLGLSVPGDVALVGCDGIEDTAYHNPPISTIVMPMAEMFAQAWDFLERRLGQPALPLQKLIVKPHLEVRGSSKR
jgi:LacI family transcriptional regulator